jgi:hypothetical protein
LKGFDALSGSGPGSTASSGTPFWGPYGARKPWLVVGANLAERGVRGGGDSSSSAGGEGDRRCSGGRIIAGGLIECHLSMVDQWLGNGSGEMEVDQKRVQGGSLDCWPLRLRPPSHTLPAHQNRISTDDTFTILLTVQIALRQHTWKMDGRSRTGSSPTSPTCVSLSKRHAHHPPTTRTTRHQRNALQARRPS